MFREDNVHSIMIIFQEYLILHIPIFISKRKYKKYKIRNCP